MDDDVDAGRVALALAQTTLSMLTATDVLGDRVLQTTAEALQHDGSLGLNQDEMTVLTAIIRSSAE